MTDTSLHFEVHPSVVYQLGESLISDAVQAIIELVKNSYDADATYSKVTIDSQGITKPEDSYYSKEDGGIITIEDDGCGMDIDDLKNGWLTISNRKKLDLKRQKRTTPKERTPLGDKGLGRLGVQKLGKNLEIYTKKNERNSKGYHLGFSWLDFMTSEKLESVAIELSEIKHPKISGTKIVISGLMGPELWQETQNKKYSKQENVTDRLKKELSRMISPYKEIRDFTVYIEVDNKTIDLIEISDSIRNNALLRYKLNFDEKKLFISGRAKLEYFFPNNKKDQMLFHEIVEKDNGLRFFNYLKKEKYALQYNIVQSKTQKWFIEFTFKRIFSELDKVEYIREKTLANPGRFFGEIDSFNLRDNDQHIFDQRSEYKKTIKSLSGIRVYRDGFAVRVDQDWLRLGDQQTIGGSFYGLRPLNTLGFISLTAKENIELEETTDREGFKDTLYYRNFVLLMEQFVKFTSTIQEELRRSWLEFRNSYNESLSNIDTQTTLEDITHTLKKKLAIVPDYQNKITIFKERIERNKSASDKIVKELETADEISPALRDKAIDVLTQFRPLLDETNTTLERVAEYLKEIDTIKGLPGVMDERINTLRRQTEMLYESVALGLTAEALSHEINNIADHLARRAKTARITLDKRNITEPTILAFIEYVKSAVAGLQKQMSFLSPTLKYVREKRDNIAITNLINELIDYYKDRMNDNSIVMKAFSESTEPFSVNINKGKLIQIIDNLVLNSEYWLKEDIKHDKIKNGIIEIKMECPCIYFSDNGRGIDQGVEEILFDPFISTKADGNGRGLGLFIVKQLLDSEGCDIELLPIRNKRKRLYKFKIDLKGVLDE
jgi:signal transduction histidine kinase